jgi:hypothetical protein
MIGHQSSQHRSDCCNPGVLANQTESQVARRLADSATTPSRVSNEVRHVGAVFAFDDSNPAIGGRSANGLTVCIKRLPNKAAVGPLPDIPG